MRATTHEFVCVECGVRFKGREISDVVKATNAVSDDKLVLALCKSCEGSE